MTEGQRGKPLPPGGSLDLIALGRDRAARLDGADVDIGDSIWEQTHQTLRRGMGARVAPAVSTLRNIGNRALAILRDETHGAVSKFRREFEHSPTDDGDVMFQGLESSGPLMYTGYSVNYVPPSSRTQLREFAHGLFQLADEIESRFPWPGQQSARSADGLQTVMFTDVVSSTPLLSTLGDRRMRDLMRDHDAVCEAAITEHGGRVVKTIGDGFMAGFSVPSAAIEAAIAIERGVREKFADSDILVRLRIGINAGEPIVEGDDLHGASVVIAKRLESAADKGEILVSDVVRQLVTGKDFEFENRGEVELKGFDQPVWAWAVRWE